MSIERLAAAGYVYIGMDHFAKPDDELAVAQRSRTLYRNIQGYSTHAECELIAFGVTANGMVGNTYSQNEKTLDEYYQRLDAGELPIYRGIALSADDLLRREIITQKNRHNKHKKHTKAKRNTNKKPSSNTPDLGVLGPMAADGLIAVDERYI